MPRPTPEQIQQMQQRIAADAEKAGMTVPQFIEHIKKQAHEHQMRMRAQQQQGGQPGQPGQPGQQGHPHPHPPAGAQGQPQAITPGPPNPKALAVAQFLKGQNLKLRTSILNGERKDMFRGKKMFFRGALVAAQIADFAFSKTCAPSAAVSRLREGSQEEPPPPRDHRPSFAGEHIQAVAT
jgi:hypothetical protein